MCIIGSHSGRIVVLDINHGKLISECILPDRVESSACISLNGEIYYIGKYFFIIKPKEYDSTVHFCIIIQLTIIIEIQPFQIKDMILNRNLRTFV